MGTKVIIYTDGAALGNPGPGGYGVVLEVDGCKRELSAGYRLTTNNRMELLAVIAGLEALERVGMSVTIYSDSRYVVDAVEKRWLFNWIQTDFRGKKNPDLWLRFFPLYSMHAVRLEWIPGHSRIAGNERCDRLASAAARSPRLLVDAYYEGSCY
ncbi:MAG: ribonuclease HI [Odoribacteraceae bacterium]|jgi:ribonuclease HI|nr:ribonuclease HI [Odoribacteraceae bacterium]